MSRSTARLRIIPRSQAPRRSSSAPVGQRQPAQLGREIRRLEHSRLDLCEGGAERIREAGETGRRPGRRAARRVDDTPQDDAALGVAQQTRAGVARPRARRRACRTCRRCPRGVRRGARRARARPGRRRRGSGRSARDHGRATRRTRRADAQPCRRVPARRRARAPLVHRSPGLSGHPLRSGGRHAKSGKIGAPALPSGDGRREESRCSLFWFSAATRGARPWNAYAARTSACAPCGRPRSRASCPRSCRRDPPPSRRAAHP